MTNYRELEVWAKAHELTLAVYRSTQAFPASERYGITSQLRRAASSVPANIAEGSERASDRDFARFVTVALGSAAEADYLLLLTKDLGYLEATAHADLASRVAGVRAMLSRLRRRLQADSGQRTADSGQRTADSGQRTADSGQRTADSGQRIADSG